MCRSHTILWSEIRSSALLDVRVVTGEGERVRTGVLHDEPMARGDSSEVAPKKSSSVGKAYDMLSQMVGSRDRIFGYIVV